MADEKKQGLSFSWDNIGNTESGAEVGGMRDYRGSDIILGSAGGDDVVSVIAVAVSVIVVALIGAWAWMNRKK